ncbi:MAG: hypothetical protein Q7R48_00005, partial [bacterium]|nr:hypothetical protein [bacterium]
VADVSRGIFSLNPKARIILGITLRPELRDKLRVMLFAVGCVEGKQPMQSNREPEKKVAQPRKKPRVVQKKVKRTAKKVIAVVKQQAERKEEVIEKIRKNALDLKQELDGKLQEIQEEEKKWDVPAFLRVKVKR